MVSRRLPTEAVRVRPQVKSCRICAGQSDIEADSLRVFRFPLPIFIPSTLPYSSSINRGWYKRPVVADVPNGLSLTPPQEIKKNVNTDITLLAYTHSQYELMCVDFS
jgi:hypothetical protein